MKNPSSSSTVVAVAAVLVLTAATSIHGFSVTSSRAATASTGSGLFGSSSKSPLFFDRASSDSTTTLHATADAAPEDIYKKKKKSLKELRAEGGIFTFNTPIGALNPFAIYYFFVSVTLGLPWVCFCKTWQFIHWLSRGRFDPKVRFAKVNCGLIDVIS